MYSQKFFFISSFVLFIANSSPVHNFPLVSGGIHGSSAPGHGESSEGSGSGSHRQIRRPRLHPLHGVAAEDAFRENYAPCSAEGRCEQREGIGRHFDTGGPLRGGRDHRRTSEASRSWQLNSFSLFAHVFDAKSAFDVLPSLECGRDAFNFHFYANRFDFTFDFKCCF